MAAGLVSFIEEILKFCCNAEEGEKLIHATSHIHDREYANALMQAASNLGLEGIHLIPFPKAKGRNLVNPSTEWMWETLKTADLIVSTSIGERVVPSPIPHYSDEFTNLIEGGVREIDITIPIATQRQVFPYQERIDRGYAGAEAIQKAETVRITNNSGSDLLMSKKGRFGHAQVSEVDKEHRWDNFGYDTVACAPLENSANGTLILELGDLIPSLPGPQFVSGPVKMTWKDGYITEIEGGADAIRWKRYLAQFEDKESYGTSHVGWSFSYQAKLGAGTRRDVAPWHHSVAGSIMIALGRNYGFMHDPSKFKYMGLGGTRKAKSHSHMCLLASDLYLDEEQIVRKGKIVREGL